MSTNRSNYQSSFKESCRWCKCCWLLCMSCDIFLCTISSRYTDCQPCHRRVFDVFEASAPTYDFLQKSTPSPNGFVSSAANIKEQTAQYFLQTFNPTFDLPCSQGKHHDICMSPTSLPLSHGGGILHLLIGSS